MDNAESGYYLSLDSCPEMYRKKDSDSRRSPNEEKERASGEQNRSEAAEESRSSGSEDTDDFIDSMTKLYSLDRGKSKIYKEFFNLYSENPETSTFEPQPSPVRHSFSADSDKAFSLKNKLFLWLLILVLLSNPILGSYNLYHFHNYSHFVLANYHLGSSSSISNMDKYSLDSSNVDNSFNNNASNVNNPDHSYKDNLNNNDVSYKDNYNDLKDNNANNYFKKDDKELLATLGAKLSKFIVRYSFIEIFGELIFGLFSLLLLSLCKLPCNNKNSIRFMMPTLFMFYMIIYRFLAFYILWATIKILVVFALVLSLEHGQHRLLNFLLAFTPNVLMGLKELVEGSQDSLSQAQVLSLLHKLFRMDRVNVYLLVVYCLENVCITFNEFVELFSFFLKLLLAQVNRKILRRKELKFYQSAETGGRVRLLKNCFKNDFFQSYDPHEKYVHSLYNYASDIGTYLKNVEIRDYSANLDHLTNKFKNKKFLNLNSSTEDVNNS